MAHTGQGTILKRGVKENEYVGMLLMKVDQPSWQTPTLLSRFANQGGTETMFLLTSAARTQFLSMDETRIYKIKVKGACVKNNSQGLKYGVSGPYEVRMQYETQVNLAQHAWPLKLTRRSIQSGL